MAFLTNLLFSKDIHNLSVAVDISGKQRMLKDYAMIGIGNNFGNPKEDLSAIMLDFENHLNALIKFNKEEKTESSLEKVKKLWIPIKKALKTLPSKEKAGKIQQDLEALLKQSNEAVGLFAKQTNEISGEIINISGRQRMLSQRMASLYMLKAWRVDNLQFKEKMIKAMDLYRNSLEKLKMSDMTTAEIMILLKKLEKAFNFFAVMNKSNDKFIPALICKKSNEMLKNMNMATGLYASQQDTELHVVLKANKNKGNE